MDMQNWLGLNGRFLVFYSILACLFISACGTQEEYGTDLIPPGWNDSLQMTDTLTVLAYCTPDDTLQMNGVDFGIIGQFNDPVFGQTNALFYSNLSVASPVQSYGPNPEIDSVLLYLKFADFYGKNTKLRSLMKFEVFELTNEMAEPPAGGYTVYNTNFPVNPLPLGVLETAPLFPVEGTEGTVLKIRLNPTLGTRFLEEDSLNASNIKSILKGIMVRATCLTPGTGNGALMRFQLNSTVSGIRIYYRTANQSGQVVRTTTASSSALHVNSVSYDRSSANPDLIQKLQDTQFDYSVQPNLYIQPFQGIRVAISIPGLDSLKKAGPMVVNRAELIIPVAEDDPEFGRPNSLIVYQLNEQGQFQLLSDVLFADQYNLSLSTFFGGFYDANKKEYRFRITRHIHEILNGSLPNKTLWLDYSITNKNSSLPRVVLRGPKDPQNKLRIELSLTSIQD
jgi:hypothetical protein